MSTSLRTSFVSVALAGLTISALAPFATAQQPVQSPKQFLGHDIGEDYFLANYTQLTSYWNELARTSDRMLIEEIGTTSYGQTMIMAIISSKENLERREEYRQISEKMARARVDGTEAVDLAGRGKAVIWIDGGLHASESIAGQNIIELPYRMLSQNDEETLNILDNVILLAVPVNPDGLEMVANAYMATRSMSLPVLYQRYVGHDNNRDFYMANQKEAEVINRLHYRHWYPQIIYNHHQSAPSGTIIFVPPFRDPFNYNIDPQVIRGIEIVGAHMNYRFTAEGKPGAINRSGASYSTWWNGGLRTAPYFHNMIGILTESWGNPAPQRLTQAPNRRLPYSDYPDPIASQELWHARQTIEYLQTSDFAILDYAAKHSSGLLTGMYTMGRRSIEKGGRDHWTPTPKLMEIAEERQAGAVAAAAAGGRGGRGGASSAAVDAVFSDADLRDPRGFIIPANQPDSASAVRFVNVLVKGGVEVQRATEDFEVGGKQYPAGSFAVMSAQAFRPQVMDMFEPQWHPDDIGASGVPIRPYDSAGWTVALQMGVEFDRILEGFDGPFAQLPDKAGFGVGQVTPGRAGWLVDHRNANSTVATNRLHKAGHSVLWLTEGASAPGWLAKPGDIFVPASVGTSAVEEIARELGVSFHGVAEAPGGAKMEIRPVRVGLFDTYGGHMPTGWTQWVLEQFEFPVQLVFGERIEAGDLKADFDVLIFHTGLPNASAGNARRGGGRRGGARGGRGGAGGQDNLSTLRDALPPFEDWSTMEARRVRLTAARAVPNLRTFVEAGGTVLALGGEATKLAAHLDLAVTPGVFTRGGEPANNQEFYIPGSLVSIDIDTDSLLGFGCEPQIATMFRSSPVFQVESPLLPVASYSAGEPLVSGWAIGDELIAGKVAVLSARVGEGRVHLYGADVLYRGQPHASFKMVFNGIQAANSVQR